MGFSPGPLFREILEAVEDAQLDGRVATREEALAFIRQSFPAPSVSYSSGGLSPFGPANCQKRKARFWAMEPAGLATILGVSEVHSMSRRTYNRNLSA